MEIFQYHLEIQAYRHIYLHIFPYALDLPQTTWLEMVFFSFSMHYMKQNLLPYWA